MDGVAYGDLTVRTAFTGGADKWFQCQKKAQDPRVRVLYTGFLCGVQELVLPPLR